MTKFHFELISDERAQLITGGAANPGGDQIELDQVHQHIGSDGAANHIGSGLPDKGGTGGTESQYADPTALHGSTKLPNDKTLAPANVG